MTEQKHPFKPTPIALESARVVAYGKALNDVVRAAGEFVRSDNASVDQSYIALCTALDHLTALGWVPGPERVGTALAGLTGAGDGG